MLTTDCMAAGTRPGIVVSGILHSRISFSATTSGRYLVKSLGAGSGEPLLAGVGSAAALGLGKEAFDYLSCGEWSWRLDRGRGGHRGRGWAAGVP
jgi:hypothetical protein